MKKRNSLYGLILIFLGSILLADQLYEIELLNFYYFWPIFILVPGVLLEVSFFIFKKDPAILVLGGVLITTGILFFFETSTNWKYSSETWPIYTFGLAVGLFQYYCFSKKNSILLFFVIFIGFISILSLSINFLGNTYSWLTYGLMFPSLIILLGIYVFFKNK